MVDFILFDVMPLANCGAGRCQGKSQLFAWVQFLQGENVGDARFASNPLRIAYMAVS